MSDHAELINKLNEAITELHKLIRKDHEHMDVILHREINKYASEEMLGKNPRRSKRSILLRSPATTFEPPFTSSPCSRSYSCGIGRLLRVKSSHQSFSCNSTPNVFAALWMRFQASSRSSCVTPST